jgi:hypothetical protein
MMKVGNLLHFLMMPSSIARNREITFMILMNWLCLPKILPQLSLYFVPDLLYL